MIIMSKKMFNLNSHSKYQFTNQLVQYLGISQKPYTIDEISHIIKIKIFNGSKTKEITWEDSDLFSLKPNAKRLGLNQMIKLVTKSFIVKEANEPDCKFFYYYQTPIEVKKLIDV